MTDAERDPLRDVISGFPEVPEEIRERFKEQMQTFLACRITGAGRIVRVLAAVLMASVALYCAVMLVFGGFLSTTWEGFRQTAPFMVTFASCLLLLTAGTFHCVYELRKGLKAPRHVQRISFTIRYGSAFFIGLVLPILALAWLPRETALPQFMFAATIVTIFYWAVTGILTVRRIARWYREDIILEQKRTQLAIALLEEKLSARSDSH